jgi:hypothetical protein
MKLIIRIIYIGIIIFLYWVGGVFTKKIPNANIEVRYLLPIVSMVFFDYYINFFARFLFSLDITYKRSILTDGKINKIIVDAKLSYHGVTPITFRLNEIKIKGAKIDSTLIYKEQEYQIPEKFEYILGINVPEPTIKIESLVINLAPRTVLRWDLYYFVMEIKYTINNGNVRTKEICFFRLIKLKGIE